VIPVEVAISPWYADYSREAGRIVTTVDTSLWTIDVGTGIQSRLSLKLSSKQYLESPVISSDGTKIAYSLVYGFGEEDIQQLWTINADGSENELVIDNTGQYITDPGPFRLIPFAWSLDNTKIYMVTTTDSEASPVGIYVADVIAGTIEKALTPQVTLWDVSFSPDRTMIAYRTFQWVPVEGSMPEIGPPFTLQVTDLISGATRILQESDTLEYHYPVWSEDGNQIAYTVRSHETGEEVGLFSIDLATDAIIRLVPGSEGKQLRPWLWLSDDRLAYTEEEVSSGWSVRATLYTIKNDGTDEHEIDSAASMKVIGVLDN
jgi:Tol biopolymer transport system component